MRKREEQNHLPLDGFDHAGFGSEMDVSSGVLRKRTRRDVLLFGAVRLPPLPQERCCCPMRHYSALACIARSALPPSSG
jgi:hypothetical protein